jgi:hypothetical protein
MLCVSTVYGVPCGTDVVLKRPDADEIMVRYKKYATEVKSSSSARPVGQNRR